jgi:dipeptidyl aminopeptidase/acylaminoacyl peptidase
MKRLLSTLCLLALAGTALSQGGRVLELGDLFLMKRVASPALSPDGRWVAYSLTTPDLQGNKNSTDLWLSPIDGGPARQLTTHPGSDRNPVWSPDGKTIAFESSRSGQGQIWLLSLDGGEPTQFTTLSTGASQPVWAPDGKSIAYVSEVFPEYSSRPFAESDSLNRARLMKNEKGAVKARVYTQLLYRHWDTWSDLRRRHIFIQNVAGGAPRNLTPGGQDAVPTSSTFSAGVDFAFSTDGTEIAYTASPTPTRTEAWSTNYDIYVVPVTGGTPKQLTTNPAADGAPRYSPDGRYIAYRAMSRPGFEADRWQLILYDRKEEKIRSLTPSFDASVGSPVWAPDSRALYFESEERGEVPIFRVDLNGTVTKVSGAGTHHDIQPSADGSRLVCSFISAVRPAEIMTVTVKGGKATPVTHANDAVFAGLLIPPPESVSFPGAGGTLIQAWLYKPPKFDPAQKYPLIMMVHGGPQNAWLNSWSYRWNPPLWAAQGYVVIAPNPRGSTGFGQEFTDAISHDWGGKVFEDLVHGLDYAQALPYVDASRTAAAGASYGGYMINWFQAQIPERFRTLVCHSGTYNFTSMYGTTEELWFDEWDHGKPWEDPEKFEQYSPHRYAKNFKTPMLIIHGELDYRVPVSEGMQMFTALQRQGIPSKFVTFPDENHWILKPANSEFWHTTVFEWLARYLK